MLRIIGIATLTLAAAIGVARADVYRWVDEHGEVHYSDVWVPGSQLIKTNKPRPVTTGTEGAQKSSDTNKVAAAAKSASAQLKDESNARAVKQDVAKAREQQCKQAKERYEKAIQARRIYKTDKSGERDYMSDADAEAYRVQSRKDVQDACGSVPPSQ
jgi:gamma-glutamyl:cysteine ligase YbdK (ATP-grasp superfamily)